MNLDPKKAWGKKSIFKMLRISIEHTRNGEKVLLQDKNNKYKLPKVKLS